MRRLLILTKRSAISFGMAMLISVTTALVPLAASAQNPDAISTFLAEHANSFSNAGNLPIDEGQGMRVERLTSGHRDITQTITFYTYPNTDMPADAAAQIRKGLNGMVLAFACHRPFYVAALAKSAATGETIMFRGRVMNMNGVSLMNIDYTLNTTLC